MTLRRLSWILFAAVLGGCAAAPSTPQVWFQGQFQGRFTEGRQSQVFQVDCAPSALCGVLVTDPDRPQAAPLTQFGTLFASPVPPLIANNNLEGARRVVKAQPQLFSDPMQGPALVPLRDLLAADVPLGACIDLSSEQRQSVLLCTRSDDASARRGAVLLVGLMRPTCDDRRPFCGYLFVPVKRTG